MNSATGSMNFLISHGQATRSTLTFSRVIHFMAFSGLLSNGSTGLGPGPPRAPGAHQQRALGGCVSRLHTYNGPRTISTDNPNRNTNKTMNPKKTNTPLVGILMG